MAFSSVDNNQVDVWSGEVFLIFPTLCFSLFDDQSLNGLQHRRLLSILKSEILPTHQKGSDRTKTHNE